MARRTSERERVLSLIALDATAVMKRLSERNEQMVLLFSRERDRNALLSPLRSWLMTARFPEIALLLPEQQVAVQEFYERLDALAWYFRYTNDMPGTVAESFALHLRALDASYHRLRHGLGPQRYPVVEAPRSSSRPPPRRRRGAAGG